MLTLNDVCEFIVDTKHKTPKFTTEGYPCIRTPNIGKGYLILEGAKYVSEETYKEWTERATPQANDLIFAREAPVGNVAIIPPNLKVCHGQRTVLIRPDNAKVDPHYLTYLLLGDEIQNKIISTASGATVPHLNMSDIRALELPKLPEMKIQQKIASILSTYDDLIENNNRRIAILEEMARSLYREWFVKFRFPGHEEVKMVDSELGQIPEGWRVAELIDFGEVVTGKTPSKLKEEYYGDEVPFIKTPDMHDGMYVIKTGEYLSMAGANSQKNKYLPMNSLLVSCIGTAGIVSINAYESQTNQQINAIKLNDEESLEFLYFALSDLKATIENYGSNGVTMTNLSKGKFERLQIIHPTKWLMGCFHEKSSSLFRQILVLSKKNQNLKSQRNMLLPKLISGKIIVK